MTNDSRLQTTQPPDAGDSEVRTRPDGAQEFVIRMPLRFSDQDAYGHVNNARTITLLEESRVRWLNVLAVGEVASFVEPKLVASQSIDYLRPVEYTDELYVHVTIGRIGGKSFTVLFEGFQQGQHVLRAQTVLVAMDPAFASRPLTDEERNYLGRFQRADAR